MDGATGPRRSEDDAWGWDIFLGLARATPPDTPAALSVAFALWRFSVLLVPVAAIVGGLTVGEMGAEMMQTASELMDTPLFHILTLGLGFIFAGMLWLLGSIMYVAALLLLVMAIPFGLLMNRALGRALRGLSSAVPGLVLFAFVTVFGFASGGALGVVMTDRPAMEPFADLVAATPWAVPLFAFILLAWPSSRRFLRERRTPISSTPSDPGAAGVAPTNTPFSAAAPRTSAGQAGRPAAVAPATPPQGGTRPTVPPSGSASVPPTGPPTSASADADPIRKPKPPAGPSGPTQAGPASASPSRPAPTARTSAPPPAAASGAPPPPTATTRGAAATTPSGAPAGRVEYTCPGCWRSYRLVSQPPAGALCPDCRAASA